MRFWQSIWRPNQTEKVREVVLELIELCLSQQLRLPNHESISATVDLVLTGTNASTVEAHDNTPAFAVQLRWVWRWLEVIAGLRMQAADPARAGMAVKRVIYRYIPSGRTLECRSVREARLAFALEAVVWGIEVRI